MSQDKNDRMMEPHQYSRCDHAALERLGLHMEATILNHDFPPHRHDFTEAFFILSGKGNHILGQTLVPLQKGDVFVVKGDTVHGFQKVDALSIVNLMYTPALFSQSLIELQTFPGFAEFFILEPELRQIGTYTTALHLDEQALQYVESMSRFIIQQEEKADPALDGVLRMNTAALMSFLATQYDASVPANCVIQVLVRAIGFMNAHIREDIHLSDIANSACVSPRHLQRLFQTYYRTRPIAYLRRLRLEQARTLLQSGTSIAEAAVQSGFSDPAYFARCYKAAYGISPSLNR